MEKSEQRKLASKFAAAAKALVGHRTSEAKYVVYRGQSFLPPGYIIYGVRKKVMFVKEWLAEKKKNEHAYMSIDAEEELTKMLTEEIAKEIEKERRAQNGR